MEVYSTPCYIINKEQLLNNCKAIESPFLNYWGDNLILGYSIKTNNCDTIINILKERKWFAEVVSYDEYKLVKKKGYKACNIICNGPVKGKMLELAFKENALINLDNLQEVYNICELWKKNPVKLINVGLRVNFNLDINCPGQKNGGEEISRFGINYENGDIKRAIELLKAAGINVQGLHMHTSTKTRSLAVFKALSSKAAEIAKKYELDIKYVDIGGGFFGGQELAGKPKMEEYAMVISSELRKYFSPDTVTLILEPGASVVATAIDYLSTVQNVRNIENECIVTMDGTLLHINPFMVKRDSNMNIITKEKKTKDRQKICGCTCMEKDVFGVLKKEKQLKRGDKIRFKNAGAYTTSFNSGFIIKKPLIYVK